jgi:hypothetical protein
MNEKYELRYLTLPDFVYRDVRHTATTLKVFGFINSYRGKFFGFSNQHLSEMFGVTEWSISKAISKLVLMGYIKTTFTIKADGGKKRVIENLKSDIGFTQSPTLALPNDKDNIKSNLVSKDTKQTEFGNPLVNFVLEEFKNLTGFLPTDRNHRNYANNLIRQVQKVVKEAGHDPKSPDGETRVKGITSMYFQWLRSQEWEVQKMETVFYKFRMFHGKEIEGKFHAKTR